MPRTAPDAPPPAAAPAWRAALDPRAPFQLPLVLMAACRLALGARIPRAGEDAYITFRYAWNWAHGLGPVFNAGERVLGVTSPPWLAWLAIGIRLGADPNAWARGTLLVADAATMCALGSLLERHASRTAAWCFALFFAAWPYWSGLWCSGLETGALLALVALTAWSIDRRHVLAGVALGLLAIVRPEGLLAALALAFWARGRDRLVAGAMLATTLLALTLYYGSPLPQSVLAKWTAYGAPGPLKAPQWWEWALPLTLPISAATPEGSNLFPLTVLAAPAAVAGAMALWSRRASALAGAALALATTWALLLASGASFFFWYLAAPLAGFALLASIGLPRLVRGRLVYASLALLVGGQWFYQVALYRGRADSERELFGGAARYLAAHARAGESLLLEPIGTIGWECRDLRVMDDVGLVTPEAASRRKDGPGWYAALLESRRPDWLLVRAGLLQGQSAFAGPTAPFRDVDEGRRALAAFEYAGVVDSLAGEQALVVFRRRR